MNDTSANPVFVALLFILRCLVPLAILFGISYLLRKMGLVAVESPEPPDETDKDGGMMEDAAVPPGNTAVPPVESTTEGLRASEEIPNETPSVENNKES